MIAIADRLGRAVVSRRSWDAISRLMVLAVIGVSLPHTPKPSRPGRRSLHNAEPGGLVRSTSDSDAVDDYQQFCARSKFFGGNTW